MGEIKKEDVGEEDERLKLQYEERERLNQKACQEYERLKQNK